MSYFIGKETFVGIGNGNDSTFDIEAEISEENWRSAVNKLDAAYMESVKLSPTRPSQSLISAPIMRIISVRSYSYANNKAGHFPETDKKAASGDSIL